MTWQPDFACGGLRNGFGVAGEDRGADTRVSRETLGEVAAAGRRLPADFTPHPRVARLLEARAAMVEEGDPIDWGCAEALAIGSLLLEGTPVRLSGQDAGRGTFSHRHAVLYDQKTDLRYVPLDHIRDGQAPFVILDSMLSENAVLGFEFGMSIANPHQLVIWEAQFGDFAVGGAPEAGVLLDPRGVTRLLLCSGKVYYDLLAARRERALDTAALVRVEQLYPFPEQEIAAIFATYPNARQIVWVQEEPWN